LIWSSWCLILKMNCTTGVWLAILCPCIFRVETKKRGS
jgi:hypothetical protein